MTQLLPLILLATLLVSLYIMPAETAPDHETAESLFSQEVSA